MNRQFKLLFASLLVLALAMPLLQCQRAKPKSKEELAKQKERAVTTKKVKPVAPIAPPLGAPAATDPIQRAFPKGPSAFDGVEALKYLPRTTSIVAVAQNPQAILERAGLEQITKSFAKYYEMAVAEVTQVVGENVLLPKNLPNVGIDPTGPVGFAMLQFDRPAGVVWWSLTDADRFKTTIYAVAGRVNERMEPHVAGDAMVICPRNDEEVCFVIKEKVAFLHFADMRDEEALGKALEFAARKGDEPSLADDEGFKKTTGALGFGKDAALYLNTPVFMDAILNLDNNWAEESLADSKRQLEEAKTAKMEGEIEYWEGRVKSDQEWAERQRKKKAAQKELFDTILSGTGTVAMGVELTERSLRFKTFTHIGEESPWKDLARPLSGPSPIVEYTAQRPFYLFHFSLDLPAYLKLLGSVLATEGMSMAELGEQFKAMTSLDLEKDLLALFSGDISFAVFGDMDKMMDMDGGGAAHIGGTLILGVTDAKTGRAGLDKLLGHELVKPFVRVTGEGQWEIPVPEWRTVTVVLDEDKLVATTDPEFIAAMKEGKRRSFVDTLGNPEVATLLGMKDHLGIAAMDFGSLAMFLIPLSYYDSLAMAEMPQPADGEAPYSDKYLALKKQKDEKRAAATKIRQEIRQEVNRLAGQMLTRIGVTVAIGAKKGNDYYGYGGHYVGDESVAKLIENLIQDGVAIEELESKRRSEAWKLEDEAYDLERQLQDVRSETLRKFEEEKYRKAQEQMRLELKTGQEPPEDIEPAAGVVDTAAPATP